jgi:hypothetical protein
VAVDGLNADRLILALTMLPNAPGAGREDS